MLFRIIAIFLANLAIGAASDGAALMLVEKKASQVGNTVSGSTPRKGPGRTLFWKLDSTHRQAANNK